MMNSRELSRVLLLMGVLSHLSYDKINALLTKSHHFEIGMKIEQTNGQMQESNDNSPLGPQEM